MIEKIIKTVVQFRALTLIIILALTSYGVYSYIDSPRDAFPDISPVMVPIFAEADGMAPEEIERLITIPIETSMSGLPDVSLVKSTSAFGMAVIYVYFEDQVDTYFARQLVSERLSATVLPENVQAPALGPISSGLGQVFIYYLDVDKSVDTTGKDVGAYLRELNDFVVKRQLQTVSGVTTILSMGGHVLQYQISLNPDQMRRYDISLDDVTRTVVANNRNVGGQYVVLGAEEFLVRGIGLLENMDDIRNLPLRTADGITVTIADIGTVEYGHEVRRGLVSLNGEKEIVAGIVLKLNSANTLEVITALHQKIDEIQTGLPKGVKIVPYYDQANLVENAAKTMENALLQGVILVVILLALSMWNWRAALIVTFTMPFCAAVAIIAMRQFNISANLMSLGGIAVALGMLVDGSIIVVENISRHLNLPENHGFSRSEIIIKSTIEVGRPIVFALLIVISVFIPLFMLEGVEGKMFKPMAFSVVVALFGSIFAAVVCVPVLATFMMRSSNRAKGLRRTMTNRFYRPLLQQALRIRWILFLIMSVGIIFSVFTLQRTGREFMPTLEEGSLWVTVMMAPSISLNEAEKVIRVLDRIILEHDEVKSTVSRIGRPEAGSHPHPVNFAEIQVELSPKDGKIAGAVKRQQIVAELREKLKIYPGVNINFSQPIQNVFEELLSGTRAYFAIKLYGENLDILQTKAEEIRHAVAEVPGVVDLATEQNYGQPQIQVVLNRDKAARLGVSGSEVMQLIESAVGGENISTIYQNTRRYHINMRVAEQFRNDPAALGELPIKIGNDTIPLRHVAEIKITTGPIQINREKNQRCWAVQGNISGRSASHIVTDMRQVIADKIVLPPGYFVEFGGQFENQERVMRKLAIIVPLVIAMIFMLLWGSFKSLRSAMIVITNVPLALIGGVIGLWMTGQALSVPAAVGFIALLGIAMQDGVVMVSEFDELRRSGTPLQEAIFHGSEIRFRSVILTTLTTLLGLLPLLLSQGIGAEVQRPLAAIVIFGLSSSTLLTLFVLPSLYYEVERRFIK